MGGQSTYRTAQRLAMGGMAEVMLAHQRGLGGLEKLVVVKRILPHLRSDPTFVEMFLEEARLAASLSHPNVVDVIDVRQEDDDLYMVMEYLSGVDLRQLLEQVRQREVHLPVPVALRVMADAAHGLHYAHRAAGPTGHPLGIVHRDVSPANIMVTFDGLTKVLDFGIARASSAESTASGAGRGQLAYASPEHLQQRPLDARSDVFSLGVVLHELLTGQPLFACESASATVHAVLERPIPPPSALNPEVVPEVDQIVSSALQREPAARTGTAGALRDALQGALSRYGTAMSQARLSRWLSATLPEILEERRGLEGRAVRRAPTAPPKPSASISVSSTISSIDEMDTTRISYARSMHTPTGYSDPGAQPMPPPNLNPGPSPWVYGLAASVATLAIVIAMGLAFLIGRSGG